MVSAPESYILSQIPDTEAEVAFAFFESTRTKDKRTSQHIWPRTEAEILEFARRGELLGVRKATSGDLVALCYATLNKQEFEIGGLLVDARYQELGLGTVLTRLAVAHVIANGRPWVSGCEIIAHIHQSNNDPRNIFARSWFEHIGTETVPDEIAPPSMRKNEQGKLVGDKFLFPRSAVPRLSEWLNKNFNETLKDGKTRISIKMPPAGLSGLREALQEEIEMM